MLFFLSTGIVFFFRFRIVFLDVGLVLVVVYGKVVMYGGEWGLLVRWKKSKKNALLELTNVTPNH